MPSRPPAPAPKGTRHPGSGRKPGTPNRITVEARTLVSELVSNPNYQHKLRADFERRKVHPTIESLIWTYHLGKPTQPIAMSGGLALDVTGRLAEEREVFAQLDLADLEQLAAESQALVDRAMALTKARKMAALGPVNTLTPQDVVIEAERVETAHLEDQTETGLSGNGCSDLAMSQHDSGSDNSRSVNSADDPETGDLPQ